MLRLNVFIRVAAENRAAALQAAKELVAASLSDKGCIAYDVFESARHGPTNPRSTPIRSLPISRPSCPASRAWAK